MTKNQKLESQVLTTPPAAVEDDGFYDIDFVCKYFGGSRPLHPATIYRGVAQGRYPRPVRPSPNVNRWIGRELKASRQAIVDAPRCTLPGPPQQHQIG